jgi:NADPH-dependent curcumin reductase CurA
MDAIFDLLNLHGRVVLCGMISQYGADAKAMGNFRTLLIRRIKVQGFIVIDYIPRFPLATLRMAWWLKRGKVKDRNTVVQGLDRAPEALVQMFNGENVGKLIVEVGEAA